MNRAATLVLACVLAAPAMAYETDRDVRHAQQMLADLGYPGGHADGRLGPRTRTAIRNFQREHNLNATGDLNDETMSALDTATAERARVGNEEHGRTAAPMASATDVRRAQDTLDRLGYPVRHRDGQLGNETRTAIRNFQRDKGLNATGELDADTRAALDRAPSGSATSGSRGDEPR
jgi:peptidoglycan hydrolase-like protein with peptidoglycan-binding domain